MRGVLACCDSRHVDSILLASSAQNDTWRTANHESGVCALYGTAGHRPDGDALDKPQNTHAQRVSKESYAELQASCPQLVAEFGGENGTYCCDARQIHDLSTKVCRVLCISHKYQQMQIKCSAGCCHRADPTGPYILARMPGVCTQLQVCFVFKMMAVATCSRRCIKRKFLATNLVARSAGTSSAR